MGLRVDVRGGDELRLDRAGVADAGGLTADDAVGVGDEAAADDGVLAPEIAGDRAAVGAGGGGLTGDGTGGVAVVDLGVAAAEDAAGVLHVRGIGGVDIAEIAAGLDEDGAVLIVDLARHAADVAAAGDLAGVDAADELSLPGERVDRVDLADDAAGAVAVHAVVVLHRDFVGDLTSVDALAEPHVGRAADEAARAGEVPVRRVRRGDGHAAVVAAVRDLVLRGRPQAAVCAGHEAAREAVDGTVDRARRLAGDSRPVGAVVQRAAVLQIQGEGADPLTGGEAAVAFDGQVLDRTGDSMEQGGVAAGVQVVQLQAGDLIAAAIIDAFERAADHGTGRRSDSTQVQVVPLQIVCFGMVLGKAREIIGVFDQKRLCRSAKALQCYLIDGHRVVTVV